MKKSSLQIIIILLLGCILVMSLKPKQWDLMIYSLLFLISFISIFQDIYYIHKTKKGIFSTGYIVDEINDAEISNQENERIIEFLSPIDNKKYHIVYLENNLGSLKGKNIKIWINQKYPHKSLVVKELNLQSILSLIGIVIFSIIFLILVIKSW